MHLDETADTEALDTHLRAIDTRPRQSDEGTRAFLELLGQHIVDAVKPEYPGRCLEPPVTSRVLSLLVVDQQLPQAGEESPAELNRKKVVAPEVKCLPLPLNLCAPFCDTY